MKNLKTILLALSVVFGSITLVKADERNVLEKKPVEITVDKFIEGITRGVTPDLSTLLADDFQYRVAYGGTVKNYSKREFLAHMKSTRNVVYNCETEYSLIESSGDYAVAKIEMKFPEFTKINYVTLCADGLSWKITNVATSYKA